MKTLSTLAALFIIAGTINAQTIVYDIPFSQTIGLQMTTGDICSAPWTTEEAFQQTAGNTWGFTWNSTGSGSASSIDVELGFTVTDGGGTFPTTLNGVSGFTVTDGAPKNCENSTLMTWSIDPANYVPGGTNTFLVNFATATNVSQVDNLPYMGDPFFRVTVVYGGCPPMDTTVTLNTQTLTANATNVTYQWVECETWTDINGETNQSFSPQGSGSYAAIITDGATGCSDTTECTEVIVAGIQDAGNLTFNIYPNPTDDKLFLNTIHINSSAVIEVVDLSGRVVHSIQIANLSQSSVIDVAGLSSGAYCLHIISEGRRGQMLFIKE